MRKRIVILIICLGVLISLGIFFVKRYIKQNIPQGEYTGYILTINMRYGDSGAMRNRAGSEKDKRIFNISKGDYISARLDKETKYRNISTDPLRFDIAFNPIILEIVELSENHVVAITYTNGGNDKEIELKYGESYKYIGYKEAFGNDYDYEYEIKFDKE
jgi:hypothetical protein